MAEQEATSILESDSANENSANPACLDVNMDPTSVANNGQLITSQTDGTMAPMSTMITSQIPTCTLTPITTVTSTGEENQAALLFLLNSSHLPSQAETTTSCAGLSSFGNAVFVPQPVTINVMSQGQNSLAKATNSDNESNVIEKAMDLANLGEIPGGESIQHPMANAALTLVSLGTAVGQPVQEIVIDESGRSSLSHDTNLGEVSVTVETEGSSPMIAKNQVANCSMVATTSGIGNEESMEDKTQIRSKLREVVTQTGAGDKEVVVLKAIEKNMTKSLSTLLVSESLERKRLAELKESQKQVMEKERPHACDKCEKKFFTKHDLKRHALVHSEVRPFECETCKKAFRTSNELKLHIPVHNTDTPYKCEFCGKEFRTKGCIKSHLKYHIGDKRHKCTICDRAFVKSADLKRHVAAHNKEKKYKCDECDSMFTRRDNLKAHMLLHSRKSVVNCKMCNKEFINTVYLKRHMHIHKQAKKKPYECQWCPKTYEQLEGLRRHIRQHVGDEKFVCEHCAKKFITAIQLKRHLWLSHEQNSPYRRSIL